MIVSLLLAASENNVIGKNNELPWHLPADLKYFKNLTWGLPILMGRKTYDSIGKPLPGRKSIVITRDRNWRQEGVGTVHSIEEAIREADAYGAREIFVIGGAQIFHAALPAAGRIYLTRIHETFDGDVYFPAINEAEWKLKTSRFCEKDEKNMYDHTFQVWERRSSANEN